jgi:hypothetical protein
MNNFEILDSLYKEEYRKINDNMNKLHIIIVIILIILLLYKS